MFDPTQPLVIFALGSKRTFDEYPDYLKVHGLGLALAQDLLSGDTDFFTTSNWSTFPTFAVAQGAFEDMPLYLVTNLTSVNSAGEALRDFYTTMGVWPCPGNVLIIQDDISVPLGKVNAVQKPLIPGGHRGVGSILRALDSHDPIRIKIGPYVKDVRASVDVGDYADVFVQVRKHLTRIVKECARVRSKYLQLLEATTAAQTWLGEQDVGSVVAMLDPPDRRHRTKPPNALPVLTWQQARAIRRAVVTLCEAITQSYRNYLAGEDEVVRLVRRHVPPLIVEVADAQGLDLNFFGLDFHGPSPTTEVTLIEANVTTGATWDVPAFEAAFNDADVVALGLEAMNTGAELMGLDAIFEYAICPHVADGAKAVAVVFTDRDDALDVRLSERCIQEGLVASLCSVADLTYDDPASPSCLMLEGTPVGVVVYLGNTRELADTPLWFALLGAWVKMFPSPGAKLFSRKSALPLFCESANQALLGLSDKLWIALQNCVAHAGFVTSGNVAMLWDMVCAGMPVPVKYVVGGGGRKSFLLERGWPKSKKVLLQAAEAIHSRNPAIYQAYAPRFPIVGTPFEFDVRAMVFVTPDGKLVPYYTARIYRVGEFALLGTAPIYVLPKKAR